MFGGQVIAGLMIPFAGTTAGAACVFIMKRDFSRNVQRALTIVLAGFIVPALPYLLAFAAGAMIYVVVEELIPEMSNGTHLHVGVILFAVGFTLMMALDVALG